MYRENQILGTNFEASLKSNSELKANHVEVLRRKDKEFESKN